VTTEHPNGVLLRRGFAAFSERDLDALHAIFSAEVRWTIPGGSVLAGTYVGLDAVLGMLGRTVALTDGTYRTELDFVLGDDAHAVARYRATGRRSDRSLDLDQLLVCSFVGGRISEARALPTDQGLFDAFWS
jgi:uncharacterized protein